MAGHSADYRVDLAGHLADLARQARQRELVALIFRLSGVPEPPGQSARLDAVPHPCTPSRDQPTGSVVTQPYMAYPWENSKAVARFFISADKPGPQDLAGEFSKHDVKQKWCQIDVCNSITDIFKDPAGRARSLSELGGGLRPPRITPYGHVCPHHPGSINPCFWDFEILHFWDFTFSRFWDFTFLRFWDFMFFEILCFWDFSFLRFYVFWDFTFLRFYVFDQEWPCSIFVGRTQQQEQYLL